MAVDTQILPIAFDKSLDTYKDAKLSTDLTVLQNAQWTKEGTIAKRDGFAAYSKSYVDSSGATGTLSSCEVLFRRGTETCIIALHPTSGDRTVWAYSDTDSKWYARGTLDYRETTTGGVIANNYGKCDVDGCTLGNYIVYSWVDGIGGVFAMVLDKATRGQVLGPTQLSSTAFSNRLVAIGAQYVMCLYGEGANLKSRRLDVTLVSGGWASAATLATDLVTTPASNASAGTFDAIAYDSTAAAIAYHSSVASNKYTFLYAKSDGTVGNGSNGYSAPATLTDASLQTASWWGSMHLTKQDSTGDLYLYYSMASTTPYDQYIRVTARNGNNLTQKLAPTTVYSSGGTPAPPFTFVGRFGSVWTSSTSMTLYFENAAYGDPMRYITVSATGTLGTATQFKAGAYLAALPFMHNSQIYVPVIFAGLLGSVNLDATNFTQNTVFLCRSDGLIVTRAFQSTALIQNRVYYAHVLPRAFSVSSGEYEFPVLTQSSTAESPTVRNVYTVASPSPEVWSSVSYVSVSMIDAPTIDVVDNNGVAIIHCGIPYIYDGINVCENDFQIFPGCGGSQSGSSGGLPTGTYSWKSLYKWVDANGNVYRSAPSFASTANILAGLPVTVSITVNTFTKRISSTNPGAGFVNSPITIEVYRTTNGGSIYYKANEAFGATTDNNTVINDTTTTAVSMPDSLSDAVLIAREVLYTQTGEVENIAPPVGSCMAYYNGRLIVAGIKEDDLAVWPSKVLVPGQGVEFSDALLFRCSPQGGAIKSLGILDDKLIINKASQSFYTGGDGPDNTGNGTFLTPVLIPGESGVGDPRTLARTPSGLVGKTKKGWDILDRSVNWQRMGARIQDFDSATCTAVVPIADEYEIRMVHSNNSILVYDYFRDRFCEWTASATSVDASTISVSSADRFAIAKANGTVIYQTPGVYTDEGSQIAMKFVTGWIPTGQLQQLGRVRKIIVVGSFPANNNYIIKLYYDYDDTTATTATYRPTTAQRQFRAYMKVQKCEAFKIEMYDAPDGGDAAQAWVLTGLSAEVGMKKGLNKLPTTTSIGAS